MLGICCTRGTASRVVIVALCGLLVAGAFASRARADDTVIFSDNFESAFAGWSKGGTLTWYTGTPKLETHSIRLGKNANIQRTVATIGWQDITISFWLGASLRKSTATVQALWYDGSTWTVIEEIRNGDPEEDGQLHYFEFALPTAAANNSRSVIRFRVNSKDPHDYGYLDDVAVVAGRRFMCTLDLAGVGGSVKVDGVPQPLPWSGLFEYGTAVILEAVPDAGHHFSGWSGALAGSANPSSVVMNADKSVSAGFAIDTYTLSLASGTGHGSVAVDGVPRSLPWSASYGYGTSISLVAVPDTGYHFTGWAGGLTGPGSPTTITMDADQTVSAGFASTTYVVHLDGAGGGVDVDGAFHALPDTVSVTHGTTISLVPVAGTGWHFTTWSGDLTGSTVPASLLVDSDKSVTVGFARTQYALNLTGTGSGSVKVNGVDRCLPWSGLFDYGDTVVLEALPGLGSHFVSWSGDLSDAVSPAWITMDGAQSIVAGFGLNTYTLTLEGMNGTVSVNGTDRALPWSGSFSAGEVVAVEALPIDGYHFVSWSGDLSGIENPTTITMDGDRAAAVEFAVNPYTLTVTGTHGSLSVDGVPAALPYSTSCDHGQVINLEAVPDASYRFSGWSGDAIGTANPIDVAVTGDTSIVASFGSGSYALSLSGTGGIVKVNGIDEALPWCGQYDYGANVTIEAVPDSCMLFSGWSGYPTDWENPTTITIDGDVTIAAAFDRVDVFSDITCDFWAARQIASCFYEGIVTGYSDGAYHPEITVTRDQMAVYVSRALAAGDGNVPGPVGDLTFTDVPAGHWAYKYIEYAVHNNIVQGYPDGEYKPSAAVTRDQMAVYIARAIVDPTGEDGLAAFTAPTAATFPDVPVDLWAFKHIEYCASQGVVRGYDDGLYHPEIAVTRDQMAVYVANAFELPF